MDAPDPMARGLLAAAAACLKTLAEERGERDASGGVAAIARHLEVVAALSELTLCEATLVWGAVYATVAAFDAGAGDDDPCRRLLVARYGESALADDGHPRAEVR